MKNINIVFLYRKYEGLGIRNVKYHEKTFSRCISDNNPNTNLYTPSLSLRLGDNFTREVLRYSLLSTPSPL